MGSGAAGPALRAQARVRAGVWTGRCRPRENTRVTAGRRGAAAPVCGLADLSEVTKIAWFLGLTRALEAAQ